MATLFQSLRRFFGNVGSTGQQEGIQYNEPFTKVYEVTPDYGIDGALQVSAVWSSVELLTDNLASLPIFVYERASGADGHKNLARDTSLWTLLHETPNNRHTPMELWQYLTLNYILRGNAYAKLTRNTAGEVISIIPLASDQVEVEVLQDQSIIYKYYYEGKVAIYAPDSMFHWRDKGNGVVGMSRLDYMRSTVNVAVGAQNHTANVFRKSAKRPGVFMIDKLLTEEQRASIRKNYKGLVEGNDDDLLVLEAGAKFEPLNMTPADVQLLQTRKFSVEDIARWFGIPSAMINDTEKTTTWGTGIDSLIQGFYKFRLRPMLESLEQAIERRILTPAQRRRYTVEFSLDAILRGSLKERLEIGAQAVQNGLMTRNEWRQYENMPPMEGADELTAQVNLAPVATLGKEQQSAQLVERMAQTQQVLVQRLADLSSKSDNLNVSVTPNIQFEMPEIRLGVDVTKDQSKSSKNIKLIRDQKGNLIGAESNSETNAARTIKLLRDDKGNLIGAESKEA
jgi:HK97 family phage portal protein